MLQRTNVGFVIQMFEVNVKRLSFFLWSFSSSANHKWVYNLKWNLFKPQKYKRWKDEMKCFITFTSWTFHDVYCCKLKSLCSNYCQGIWHIGIDYSVYSPMCSNQFLLRVYWKKYWPQKNVINQHYDNIVCF